MSRPKLSSKILEKAQRRAAALESITDTLNFGEGLTLDAYTSTIANLRQKINAYNTLLSSVDKAKNEIQQTEQILNDLSERMLTGVATKYGKNSNEYDMAGGVRKSERKPRSRKPMALSA